MDFVSRLDNAYAWLRKSGVYQQAELYHRGDTLFAKVGRGYVRLSTGGTTSHPQTRWLELDPGDANIVLKDGTPPVYVTARAPSRDKLTSVPF